LFQAVLLHTALWSPREQPLLTIHRTVPRSGLHSSEHTGQTDDPC